MSYQNPAFMVAHPSSLRSIADFATLASNTFTDDSKRALIDSRQGEQASYTADGAASGFTLDMGSTTAADPVNRLVVPGGHTFDGYIVLLISGVTLGSISVRSSTVVADKGVIDASFSDRNGDQFWGLQVINSVASDVFSFGEFWVGNRRSLNTNDARVDQGFEREYEHDLSEEDFGGRTVSLELSPARRSFSLQVRDLDPSGADFATLDEVIRDGRSKPFWYWTPDSTDTGPYLVKLTRAARRKQSSKVPTVRSRYEVSIEMLEQVT